MDKVSRSEILQLIRAGILLTWIGTPVKEYLLKNTVRIRRPLNIRELFIYVFSQNGKARAVLRNLVAFSSHLSQYLR